MQNNLFKKIGSILWPFYRSTSYLSSHKDKKSSRSILNRKTSYDLFFRQRTKIFPEVGYKQKNPIKLHFKAKILHRINVHLKYI